MRICICGGGHQGHISAGVIGSKKDCQIDILTRHPEKWSHNFTTFDLDGREYHACLGVITDKPEEVIPFADIVYICVPGDAVPSVLDNIKPFLNSDSIIGSPFGGSGFFLQAFEILGFNIKAFALQRVPYTGRTREYGHSATLQGYKPYLKVACYNIPDPDSLAKTIEGWYSTPTSVMSHFLDATLSNSNPLLHPCRLYVLFKDCPPEKIYNRIPYLYRDEWDEESSELWLACDGELSKIMSKLPMDSSEVPSVLEYYGVKDMKSLTHKMQNIVPFWTLMAPMIEVEGGYKIDPSVRSFTEDIPFGMLMIKAFAELVDVETPNIDKVIYWAQDIMGRKFIEDGKILQESLTGPLSFLSKDNLSKAIGI